MQGIDFWRLCDDLSIVQAALLVVGENPSIEETYILDREPHNRADGFNAVFAALKNAINCGNLKANIQHNLEKSGEIFQGYNSGKYPEIRLEPDWMQTTVNVYDLQDWLLGRGVKTGFFFPDNQDRRNYFNKNNPFYAPKLAAAIKAWEAVTADEARLKAKTPKQALEKYLREHASEFGLTKEDGSPNEDGIQQICKVANWKPEGGAAKTPTPMVVKDNLPTPKKTNDNQDIDDLDDEAIPF